MVASHSLWAYFAQAGLVVKTVMLVLFSTSLLSWAIIIQRLLFLRNVRQEEMDFEECFWSGKALTELLIEVNKDPRPQGMAIIFQSGFKEFIRLQKRSVTGPELLESTQRAMRIACARETESLENHLPLLASVGSVTPYIGLFGTVWGIMTSFQALGSVQQATIAMVAPGISEALIATAMGLFAAIPAVLAYNRFSTDVDKIISMYDTFQDELSSILHRQVDIQQG